MVVCSIGDGLCSAGCSASGYSNFKYDCRSDSCRCANNPVSACFPGTAMVYTINGPTLMSKLSLGDEVLSVTEDGELQYNKVRLFTAISRLLASSHLPMLPPSRLTLMFLQVYMFSTYRPNDRFNFFQITTSAGFNITLTSTHFIFAKKARSATGSVASSLRLWDYLTPADLDVGDFVLVQDPSRRRTVPARIQSIKYDVPGVGIYNPHVRTGALLVDGIVASDLTAFVPKWMAGRAFHRAMAFGLQKAFSIVPQQLDNPLARSFAKLAGHSHGDAMLSRDALLGASMDQFKSVGSF
jgi:hypothetical protein